MFSLWDDSIYFCDGWFIYSGAKGNNSVISWECANKIECDYYKYQASMDVNMLGYEYNDAYLSRGLVKNENNEWILPKYQTDELPIGSACQQLSALAPKYLVTA